MKTYKVKTSWTGYSESYCEWEFYKQGRNYNTEENGGIIIVFNTIKESNNDT